MPQSSSLLPDGTARARRRTFGARAAVTLLAGWGLVACAPGPRTSSSSHWIVCAADADCENFSIPATCGVEGDTAGFCIDATGTPLELRTSFEAEFIGQELDRETFQFELGADIRNGELQAYTESSDNVFVEDGELVIVARNEPVDGAEYSSGSVEVIEPLTFGRVEASILAHVGSGAKPAFWLLPSDPGPPETTCDDAGDCIESTWPVWGGLVVSSGRADGSSIAVASYASVDAESGRLELTESAARVAVGPSMSTDYHLYAMEWGPLRVDWFVDDELVHSFDLTSDDIYHPGGVNPFHQPFRLKLTLAVGGLVEDPEPTDYPREMRVRSLRVLQVER